MATTYHKCRHCGAPFSEQSNRDDHEERCRYDSSTPPTAADPKHVPTLGGCGLFSTVPIQEHEGKKYLRWISGAAGPLINGTPISIQVDVYCVLEAFGITCQATGHALKKLLCAGDRGKGDRLADLKGALAAVNRAIELEERRRKDAPTMPSGGSL